MPGADGMAFFYESFIPLLWLAWLAYWWLASRGVKPTERHEPLSSRLLHIVPLGLAVILLASNRLALGVLNARLLAPALWQFWVAGIMTAAGLLFTIWARVHLGDNWSGTVTIKRHHDLIVTGPYAIVRHPIYTGLLAALVGAAVARNEWRGVLAVLIALAALWRKLRLEERWMAERFGERYAAYARAVPALLPFSRPLRRPGSAG
jgi:protein-S-isoprenylcysteine O-methyltransferase Ste14